MKGVLSLGELSAIAILKACGGGENVQGLPLPAGLKGFTTDVSFDYWSHWAEGNQFWSSSCHNRVRAMIWVGQIDDTHNQMVTYEEPRDSITPDYDVAKSIRITYCGRNVLLKRRLQPRGDFSGCRSHGSQFRQPAPHVIFGQPLWPCGHSTLPLPGKRSNDKVQGHVE